MAGRPRVVVTGATRGIGREIALTLALHGATVGVTFRPESAEVGRRLADELGGAPIELDVSDVASHETAARAFVEQAGGLDAWVVGAGIVRTGLIVTQTQADWDELWAVDVRAGLAAARAAIPHMLRGGGGTLLFLGSVAASSPRGGAVAYAACKAALEAVSRGLAIEYGRKKIRSVCLHPRATATRMLEGVEALAPDEIGPIDSPQAVAAVAAKMLLDSSFAPNGSVLTMGCPPCT